MWSQLFVTLMNMQQLTNILKINDKPLFKIYWLINLFSLCFVVIIQLKLWLKKNVRIHLRSHHTSSQTRTPSRWSWILIGQIQHDFLLYSKWLSVCIVNYELWMSRVHNLQFLAGCTIEGVTVITLPAGAGHPADEAGSHVKLHIIVCVLTYQAG